ncbi:hypothetical protein [Rhodovulum sp. MB263]|uniref:hypothetical protein n=1 Tax=Rhodovulum sp. (strain MB263) TaxID=308754 RepID=UPI0018C8B457|nr:hypothetical protein [Rhodovulum sp. MB263]
MVEILTELLSAYADAGALTVERHDPQGDIEGCKEIVEPLHLLIFEDVAIRCGQVRA